MRISDVLWDERQEEHVRAHGVEPFEVEEVLASRKTHFRHYSGPRYYAFGTTVGGRYLFVVFDDQGAGWIYPVTARDMTVRERHLYWKKFRKGRKR